MIPAHFKSIFDFQNFYKDEQTCIDYLEQLRWGGQVVSPFDCTSSVYKLKNGKYKCRNTNKYFNVRTGSIFEASKIPLKTWFLAMWLFIVHKKGISSYQLSEELGITQKTAWFLLQRIRFAMEEDAYFEADGGMISMDETFVGGKDKNRHRDKKVAQLQGRSFKDKTPVFGILQNNQKVKCFVIPDTKSETMQPIIEKVVQENALVVTDEWCGYDKRGGHYHYEVLFHNKGLYINEDGFSSNAIENFWSHFKRGINGLYLKVSRKHLQKYADEFSFRYNNREGKMGDKVHSLLNGTINRRLKYSTLIAK